MILGNGMHPPALCCLLGDKAQQRRTIVKPQSRRLPEFFTSPFDIHPWITFNGEHNPSPTNYPTFYKSIVHGSLPCSGRDTILSQWIKTVGPYLVPALSVIKAGKVDENQVPSSFSCCLFSWFHICIISSIYYYIIYTYTLLYTSRYICLLSTYSTC